MKTLITTILLSLGIVWGAKTQSRTIEITPTFHAHNREYISEVNSFELSFEEISFIGLSCYHFESQSPTIEYRILEGDRWSTWQTFLPQHEMGESKRKAYEGELITSTFSGLQFKTSEQLNLPLTVRIFVGTKQKSSNIARKRSATCTQPDHCDRSCWCATCPVDVSPQITVPTHIIVHHSAGSNDTTLNFSEVVNFIWDLHVNTNGWDDIGYNWLIDPDGVVYEGRPDNFQGAHFSCLNENTVGICLLGNFTSVLPSDEAVKSLINLAGYEATDHEIDVLSESYHEKGDFNLVNIAGHRDSAGSLNACSSTACPGNTFYPKLDSIRAAVADLECYENEISAIEVFENSKWNVFPNPFQNVLEVRHPNKNHSAVEIRNLKGELSAIISTEQRHDLSHLESGMYFIIYEGEIIQKVIKQ